MEMLCLVTLALLALRPIEAFDTFWQLQSGKYIWQTGAFIYTDLFSIAKDVFRLEHCWLSDLIFYALYSLGGYGLLGLLKPLVIAACGLLLYRWNRLRPVEPAILLPVLSLCLLASEPSWLVRPQLWTFLLSLLTIHLLFVGRQRGLRAWLWLVPIMLAWANLHAACVFGFVLIGLFWLGELVRYLRRQTTALALVQLAGVGLLVLGASFVNPYGYRIPMVLLGNINLHAVDNPGQLWNMEWLPPTFEQVPLFYLVMSVWGLLVLLRLRRLDPVEGIYFLAFLYMGLSMIRHTTLVALLAGYFLPLAVQQGVPYFSRPALRPLLRGGTLLVLAGMLLYWGAAGVLGVGLKESEFPVGATAFLQKHKLPANLYNSYDWGGYLMWQLYPDYLVFVDGRTDSLETFNASSEIDNRWPNWSKALDDYDVNTVLTRTDYYDTGAPLNLIDGLVSSPGWALVYSDDVALVFVRRQERFRAYWESLQLPSVQAYETMYDRARRALEEDSSRSMALLALGRSSIRLGRIAECLEHYRHYLAIDPQNREAQAAVSLLSGRIRP
ncbi:hypothetical protein [Trichloromonas sp.]|uniref:hypothetical protein n=1 Tax=Trichloromonas sp. TaxID=3069249 RepID=UPI003D81C224